MFLSQEVDEALERTGNLLARLVEAGGLSSGTSAALPSLYTSFHSLKQRALDDNCTVAVLALAKSGKSTLINALLGEALLPSSNVPETARITAIHHTPAALSPRLSYQAPDGQTVQMEGGQDIREHLRQLNVAARAGEQGMLAGEAPLEVAAPFAALASIPGNTLGCRIAILDTPGPNEAGQDQLRYKVERLLEGVDAVVYILDWTKLKTTEETAVLQRLHELNPSLVHRLCHRCFFVVNKMDMAQSAEGMDEEETRDYVATLVSEQLNVPGFELQPEQIFLVSARDALRSRLVLRADVAAAELDNFRRVAFGQQWRRITDPEIIRETAVEMLSASGLPELEERVMGFLGSRAAVLHLVATLDDLERLLAQVHNLGSTSVASLHQGVAALSAQVAGLQGRLASTLLQFEGVGREVQELEGLVVDEVRERMGRLRCRLEDHIKQVLTPNAPPTVPHGRWPAVWSMAKRILRTTLPGRGVVQDAAGAEGEEAEQQLQMKLSELHSMIYLQIESETRDFWHSLEQATNQRQRQLFGAINSRMAELGQAIEGEVAGALCCTLEPVDMRLKPPTAEQFHVNLQQLLQRGIQREVQQEVEEVTREHVVYEKRSRDSMCKKFEWWEPTTQTRTEQLRITRTRYTANPEAIQAYFLGVVDETISNSVAAVRSYVHAYLAERLAEARGKLAAYAERYTAAMNDALSTARMGEAERAEALHAAQAHCSAVGGLLEDVHDLQQRAEELLEGWVDEQEAPPELEVAPASSEAGTAAASTVAALAELQSGHASQLTSAGSTAQEVAAAYADQQVAALEASLVNASLLEESPYTETGAEAEVVAEVPLHDEASGGSGEKPAVVRASGEAAGETLGGAGGWEEDADSNGWTVVSDAEAEEDEEAPGGTTASMPQLA